MVNNLEYTCGENCLYDDYFVFLTVEGTSIENVKVRVSNPWRSLKEQIKRIVGVFRLPWFDAVGSCPISFGYSIGKRRRIGDY